MRVGCEQLRVSLSNAPCLTLCVSSRVSSHVVNFQSLMHLLSLTLQAAEEELIQERDCVSHLIGREGGACQIGPGAPDTSVPGEN